MNAIGLGAVGASSVRVACDELSANGDVVIGDRWQRVRAVQCADVVALDAAMQRAIDLAELLACFDALLFEAHNDLLRVMVENDDLQTALRGVPADEWAQTRAELVARGDRLLSASTATNDASALYADDLWSVDSATIDDATCNSQLSAWSSGATARQTTATSALSSRLAQIEARLRQAPSSLATLPAAGGVALVAVSDALGGARALAAVADDALLQLDAASQNVSGDVLARLGALGRAPTSARPALPLHIADSDRPSAVSQATRARADFVNVDASSALYVGALAANVGGGALSLLDLSSSSACVSASAASLDVQLCGSATRRNDLVTTGGGSLVVVVDSDAATVLNVPASNVVRQPPTGADKSRIETALASFRNRTFDVSQRLFP